MKKQLKKLALNVQAIRQLSSAQLEHVNGAATGGCVLTIFTCIVSGCATVTCSCNSPNCSWWGC